MNISLQANQNNKLEIPAMIRGLSAVVAVIIDDLGFLQEANKGFFNLIKQDSPPEQQWNIREFFINPDFASISSLSSSNIQQPIYHGIMNIGNPNSAFHSVIGSVYRHQNKLLIIAEYDIADFEQLTATVIELNDELTQTQRNLVNSNRSLKRNEARITELMLTDQLTGIANRRHFDQRFKDELQRHLRYQQPLTLVMCDIDFFKRVNDDYGHAIGDKVICSFTETLNENKRASDFVARIGGEEFTILLPQTSTEEAFPVIERIRNLFSEKNYDGIDRKISASFGLSCLIENDSADSILKRADQALYKAKETGRNKVVIQNN